MLSIFSAEARTLRKYIVDDVKEFVNSSHENKLMDYVEMGGRSTEKPLSYSTIDKVIYTQFINKEPLSTNFNYKKDDGKNPRDLEKNQLIKLMNILAEKLLLDGKFDRKTGTGKLEDKIRKCLDDGIPITISWDHIRACRILEEVCFKNWMQFINVIIMNYFNNALGRSPKENFFQEDLDDRVWENIENYIENLSNLPLWKNAEFSRTVFGGKPNDEFWRTIFTKGETIQGIKVLNAPINVNDMIKK